MSTVLAAVDNSAAARPVLRGARLLAAVMDADIEAIHVRAKTTRTAEAEAQAAGLSLEIVDGDPVEVLAGRLARDDVALGVFGARRLPAGRRPAGHTTLAAATRSNKPVLVVPPQAQVADPGVRVRIIVPLDGSPEADQGGETVRRMFEPNGTEITIMHVFTQGGVPRFWDQPLHDEAAWAREFLARHWPGMDSPIRLEHGAPAAAVLALAEAEAFDVIALVWGQRLGEDRAGIVRRVLADAEIPVLLIPVLDA
jgi:nucleotide-binding universal stress UspA family protein